MKMGQPLHEADVARTGAGEVSFRAEDIASSVKSRADYKGLLSVVTAQSMPFEHSADGLIKHLVHHKMGTHECCVEAYMLFLERHAKSGRHRHMWEEVIFVVEGEGYDLHWDLSFDCKETFVWEWATEPRQFAWKRGDFIYVPPYTEHQHVATSDNARLIVISNRIVKEMGFNWFDMVEPAPQTPEESGRVR
jgi:quercetin dioxygenase-like cupin family protein